MKFLACLGQKPLNYALLAINAGTILTFAPMAQAAVVDGRTDAPPYATSKNPNYETVPLLTVGDEVPWLNGTWGNYSPDSNRKFAMAGIPDGLGVFETATRNYVFMDHEIGTTKFNGAPLPNIPENYIFTYFNNTDGDKVRGARVSIFEFDKDWKVIGGRNLIETAIDNSVNANGTVYQLNTSSGFYVTGTNPISIENTLNSNPQQGFLGAFSRFCSGFLAQGGFVDDNGQEIPFWFAPEEDSNPATNRGWAVTANGIANSLDGLGRFQKENVVAAAQYRPLSEGNTSNKTVLLSTEDYRDGELYMWVGNQTDEDPNGFQDGKLYVLQAVDSNGNVYAYETIPEDVPVTAKWVEVPADIAKGVAGQTDEEITKQLSEYVNGNGANDQPRSTNFRRLEDIAEDPTQLGTFYFAVTGTTNVPEGGSEPDNPSGKIYRISLNPDNPEGDGALTLVHAGGFGNGVSFDNLTVLTNGKVWVQEDAAYDPIILGGDPLGDEDRQAYIWEFDPNANGGTGAITPIAEMLEDAYPDLGNDPSKYGEWESSGIVQVGNLAPNTPWTLFDIEAHTDLRQNERFSEGGQLMLLVQQQQSPSVPEPATAAGLFLFGLSTLAAKSKRLK